VLPYRSTSDGLAHMCGHDGWPRWSAPPSCLTPLLSGPRSQRTPRSGCSSSPRKRPRCARRQLRRRHPQPQPTPLR
jgi:hypothetical protein